MAKEKYWTVLDVGPPNSFVTYRHKQGYTLYKVFHKPNSPIGIWYLVDASGNPLGAKSSTHRDIVTPPKGWANGLVDIRERARKETKSLLFYTFMLR